MSICWRTDLSGPGQHGIVEGHAGSSEKGSGKGMGSMGIECAGDTVGVPVK